MTAAPHFEATLGYSGSHHHHHHHHGVRKKRRRSIQQVVPGSFGLWLLNSPGARPKQTETGPEGPPPDLPDDERELKERMLKNVLVLGAAAVLGPMAIFVAYRLVLLSYLLVK